MLGTARSGRWPCPTTLRPVFPSRSTAPAESGWGPAPDGDGLGLAYSDDGGETWTDVALPQQVRATSAELATSAAYGDKLLEIAADGDRVAVAASWGPKGRAVYVSDDAGQSWTTATPSEPEAYATEHTCTFLPTDGWC